MINETLKNKNSWNTSNKTASAGFGNENNVSKEKSMSNGNEQNRLDDKYKYFKDWINTSDNIMMKGNGDYFRSNNFILCVSVPYKSTKESNILNNKSGIFYTNVYWRCLWGKDYKSIYIKITALDEPELKGKLFDFYKANVIDDKDCAWIYNEDFFYETTCFHPSFNYTKDDINLIKSNFKINFFDIYGSKDGVYFPPYNPLKKTAQSKSMNSNTTAHKSKIDKIVEYLINDSPNIVDDLDYISSNSITMFNSIIEHEDMVKEIVKRNISDFISDDVRKIGSIALPENHRM